MAAAPVAESLSAAAAAAACGGEEDLGLLQDEPTVAVAVVVEMIAAVPAESAAAAVTAAAEDSRLGEEEDISSRSTGPPAVGPFHELASLLLGSLFSVELLPSLSLPHTLIDGLLMNFVKFFMGIGCSTMVHRSRFLLLETRRILRPDRKCAG